ncbi:hypothetical protein RQP46_006415 [Phenoliferia psychrophenolica]
MESALDPFTLLKDKTPPKPAPPPAAIRPFSASKDLKVARYLIGAGIMEPSSLANLNTLWTPFFLFVWAAFTHILVVRFGRGWPTSLHLLIAGEGFQAAWESLPFLQGVTQWLTIIPLLVTPPIVLLAAFELRHRNRFEDEMSRAIGEEDMRDIPAYYATDNLVLEAGEKPLVAEEGGRKGFWVFEFDGRMIGAMALDGRRPAKTLDSIVDLPSPVESDNKEDGAAAVPEEAATTSTATDSPYPLRNRKSKASATETEVTSKAFEPSSYTGTVQLRRFATSPSFRPAKIEDDLLQLAAAFAFAPTSTTTTLPPAKRITIALRPTVEKPLLARLKANGFKPLPSGDVDELNPDGWKDGKAAAGGVLGSISSLLDKVWPLDLSWKTYALDRDAWVTAQKA